MKRIGVLAAALLVFLAGACNKGPAETALQEVDQALAAARPELETYVPEDLESITAAARRARSLLDEGQYTEALRVAQDLPARIRTAVEAAAATRVTLTATWTEMSGAVPGLLRSLDERVAALGPGETLAGGMAAERLAALRAELRSLNDAWAEAESAFRGGDVPGAVKTARETRARAEALAGRLRATAAPAPPAIIDASGPGPGSLP
jgi:hypothetical protein